MLKKILLFTLLFASTFHVKAQTKDKDFIITGKLIGRDTGFVWIRYWDKNGKEIRDTSILSSGKFTFKGTLEEPIKVILTGNVKGKIIDVNDPNQTELFIEQGKNFISIIQNQFKNAKVIGSFTQDELQAHNEKNASNIKILDSLNAVYTVLDKEWVNADSNRKTIIKSSLDKIVNEFDIYRERQKQLELLFIKSHPNSYVSPALLSSYIFSKEMSTEIARTYYNSFSKKIKESRMGKIINDKILEREMAKVGNVAYKFSRQNRKGETINLLDFQGKYVLLDFWASWCIPCRAFNPELKALYSKYNSLGLEIISISSDIDKKNWLNAIKADGTGIWTQILSYDQNVEQYGKETPNNLVKRYNVRAIPVMILLDKKGTIIGRYLGEGEVGTKLDLTTKLSQLFKKSFN